MRPSEKTRHPGFTLVELLVAMLVLTIMMLAVIGVVNSATTATGNSRKRIDADSEARTVFDRIADDLAHLINRSDVDFALGRNNGPSAGANDALFFYAEASALANPTGTAYQQNTSALIGYRINAQYELERLGKGLVLAAEPPNGVVCLTYPTSGQPASSTPAPLPLSTFSGNPAWLPVIGSAPTYTGGTDATNYHVLGESVFRFEFCYLLKPYTRADGSIAPAVYSNYPNRQSNANSTYTYATGLQQVQALVVALALLDPASRQIVNVTDLANLAGMLPDPIDTNLNPPAGGTGSPAPSPSPAALMAQTWDNALAPGNSANANLNSTQRAALPNVRVYQRTFQLAPFLQ